MLNSQYLEVFQDQLARFAAQDNFNGIITTAFGKQVNQLQLQDLQLQWLNGDFSVIPDIQVLSNGELGQASGAYSAELDRIFVSSDFLARASEKSIASLLLEEVGHRLDKLLNGVVDSAGDEGEIFSLLVNGNNLSSKMLVGLQSQNDQGMIELEGRSIGIEKRDINGDEGDNFLFGSFDPDLILGFGGFVQIFGEGGRDRISGGDGGDILEGGDGDDIIDGGDGDDLIDGQEGFDELFGEDGNDRLFGRNGNDKLFGQNGNDELSGGNGDDSLFGGDGDDSLNAGFGNNFLEGENGNDSLIAGDGNDDLRGGAGNDSLISGNGNDSLFGGDGNDIIDGGFGNDSLDGGNGDDSLNAGGGNDSLFGQDGNDTYIFDVGNAAGSRVTDTSGVDVLTTKIAINDSFNIVALSSSKPAVGITGIERVGTNLIIDINRDGSAVERDDLSIINFFDVTGTVAGTGFIETVGNLSGQSILDRFKGSPTQLLNTDNRFFQITGDRETKNFAFRINSQNQKNFSETGIFKVDNNLGSINGIQPGGDGYLNAVLERLEVISSIIPISNLPQGFDGKTTRNLNVNSGDIVRFGIVSNGSIDQLRQDPSLLNRLTLSEPTTLKVTNADDGKVAINWQAPINISLTGKIGGELNPSLGTRIQNTSQGELLDFRRSNYDIEATFSIYREAAYNNSVYFYTIQDETGAVLDSISNKVLLPTDVGYLQAALRNALPDVNLSTPNQSTTSSSVRIAATGTDSLLAPIIVVNGKKDALLDSNLNNDPAAYTPFILGNKDKVDHIRLLGDNTFGFEDLTGGGDLDYNDIIIKMAFKPIV